MKGKNRVMLLIAVAMFAVLFFTNVLDFRIAFGSSSVNRESEWSSSFKYLHGKRKGFIRLGEADSTLIFVRDIRKGSLTFDVYGPEDNHIAIIGPYSGSDTLRVMPAGKAYRIVARANNASGSFSVRTE